jgi:hypothetical protein
MRRTSTARPAPAAQPAASESTTQPVSAAPSNALAKQLAALERWLEGPQESRISPAEAGSADKRQPVTESAATARSPNPAQAPQPAPSASSVPQSRLEIGSIEVEVVTPAKVPVSRERQMPPRPARASEHRFHARPFGWRQR